MLNSPSEINMFLNWYVFYAWYTQTFNGFLLNLDFMGNWIFFFLNFQVKRKKMQASTFAVKGGIGFGVQKRTRISNGFGEFKKPSLGLRMTDRSACCGLRTSSTAMETELTSARVGAYGIFRSSAKPRSVKAQATGLFMKYLDWLAFFSFSKIV